MRSRPTDPDLDVDKPKIVQETGGRKFNPTPEQWRKGKLTKTPVDVWCRYDRQMEIWIPIVMNEHAIVRNHEDNSTQFVYMGVVHVFQEQAQQQGMIHVDFNAGLIPFLEWLDGQKWLNAMKLDHGHIVSSYLAHLETQVS